MAEPPLNPTPIETTEPTSPNPVVPIPTSVVSNSVPMDMPVVTSPPATLTGTEVLHNIISNAPSQDAIKQAKEEQEVTKKAVTQLGTKFAVSMGLLRLNAQKVPQLLESQKSTIQKLEAERNDLIAKLDAVIKEKQQILLDQAASTKAQPTVIPNPLVIQQQSPPQQQQPSMLDSNQQFQTEMKQILQEIDDMRAQIQSYRSQSQ